ncbi:antimicrobial peptide NK-lysin [Cololabis saira]|uniref:antimicrobial peptide NK-lysin n=1 Tax=Cololabis saira TaxID=129043 RepID=UPI002AD5231F|nr:antimicrobial peptide NK-lysin [Cololabis saira]
METSSVLLLSILLTCSVWAVNARRLEISIDDEQQVDMSAEARRPPGMCWGCKWALGKVRKMVGPNATAERVKAKLNTVCDEIGLLKSACRKFVKSHLGELIVELTTTDDVRTICVHTGACKPKELFDLHSYSKDEEPLIEIHDFP